MLERQDEGRNGCRDGAASAAVLSRYLMESGLRGCPPPTAEERAQRQRAIFLARKIDTNLNQIAHRLHGEALGPPIEWQEALAATTPALVRLGERQTPMGANTRATLE